MAQASSSWRQLINQISEMTAVRPTQHIFKQFSEPGILLGLLTIIVAMLLWNWQLLLALVVGIGIMVFTYSVQKLNWQLSWSEIRKFISSTNSRLAYSIVSGGIATVITYMASAIWVESQSHWLAAGAIIQGVGTILTLILLVWQIFNFQEHREEDYLDQLLNNLTQKDVLKRFVAIQQLNRFVNRQNINTTIRKDVVECLKILLIQEKEAMIREVALDCLQNLDELPVLKPINPKVLISVPAKIKNKILVD